MKLHYSKILLFILTLNIFVECVIQTSIYDNDEDMKHVKEIFDRQSSQRFEEYDQRMKDKRQKYKEQCDKDIQKIILKDKMEKSIAEKVEKGVAASVGLIGGLVVNELKKVATAAAIDFATKEGIKAGIHVVIERIKDLPFISNYLNVQWTKFINGSNYNTVSGLVQAVKDAVDSTANTCTSPTGQFGQVCQALSSGEATFRSVVGAGQEATASTTGTVQKSALDTIEIATTTCTTAITASVIAIVLIVLVMIIIYLILRYHRKKKNE
ncbi:rifin [Plasmodium falciparum RAJ116]|uniref:Rifin n=1 Tax=Plasmodium falciparum RAJ116 TaxID=580058 RepID=A0A0L0CYV0_PLAFA|nr:rifin [Plasmodium falciparum RAJ116]